jgi:hypothetical protein
MKAFVGVLLLVGSVMVYFHSVFGVLVLVAAAWAVPMVVREIHDERAAVDRRRSVTSDDPGCSGQEPVPPAVGSAALGGLRTASIRNKSWCRATALVAAVIATGQPGSFGSRTWNDKRKSARMALNTKPNDYK